MSKRMGAGQFSWHGKSPASRTALGLTALAATAILAACSSGHDTNLPSVGMRSTQSSSSARPGYGPLVSSGPNVAAGGGTYKLGSPYRIGNVWYVPREEPGYDRIGTGSWYGADFHGRRTANGEIYDMNALTAAHPTLPLPSYLLVTNLANNRTIMVRVNDRGPYVADRQIDLSRAAARALGYESMGTANLRVRYAGRAPLNGDATKERAFLASQPWALAPMAAAPSQPQYRQAYVEPAPPQPPSSQGWSTDRYRRSLPAANASRPKESSSSWLPSWGLGSGS